jgi:hypothetical protein
MALSAVHLLVTGVGAIRALAIFTTDPFFMLEQDPVTLQYLAPLAMALLWLAFAMSTCAFDRKAERPRPCCAKSRDCILAISWLIAAVLVLALVAITVLSASALLDMVTLVAMGLPETLTFSGVTTSTITLIYLGVVALYTLVILIYMLLGCCQPRSAKLSCCPSVLFVFLLLWVLGEHAIIYINDSLFRAGIDDCRYSVVFFTLDLLSMSTLCMLSVAILRSNRTPSGAADDFDTLRKDDKEKAWRSGQDKKDKNLSINETKSKSPTDNNPKASSPKKSNTPRNKLKKSRRNNEVHAALL